MAEQIAWQATRLKKKAPPAEKPYVPPVEEPAEDSRFQDSFMTDKSMELEETKEPAAPDNNRMTIIPEEDEDDVSRNTMSKTAAPTPIVKPPVIKPTP